MPQDKKMGPTEMQAEVERLKAAGKLPSLEEILKAVGESRQKFAGKIKAAQKLGPDKSE